MTRAAILSAAMDLFAQEGFEAVRVRSIGARAGVDAALISRYFGGKAELFVEIIRACDRNWRDLWGDHDSFAQRAVAAVFDDPPDARLLRGVRIMLRSCGSEHARRLIDQTFETCVFSGIEAWLGGSDADVRARLLLGLISGMAFVKDASAAFDMDPERTGVLRRDLSDRIDHLLGRAPTAG